MKSEMNIWSVSNHYEVTGQIYMFIDNPPIKARGLAFSLETETACGDLTMVPCFMPNEVLIRVRDRLRESDWIRAEGRISREYGNEGSAYWFIIEDVEIREYSYLDDYENHFESNVREDHYFYFNSADKANEQVEGLAMLKLPDTKKNEDILMGAHIDLKLFQDYDVYRDEKEFYVEGALDWAVPNDIEYTDMFPVLHVQRICMLEEAEDSVLVWKKREFE